MIDQFIGVVIQGNLEIFRKTLDIIKNTAEELATLTGKPFSLAGFINTARKDGTTPLMTAVDRGHEDIVAELLAAGAKRDPKNKDGRTAFHFAAARGKVAILTQLIKSEEKAASALLQQTDNFGWTPLHFAAQSAHVDVVKLLLKSSQAVNAMDQSGQTALYKAATWRAESEAKNDDVDRLQVLELLVSHGAMVEYVAKFARGNDTDSDSDTEEKTVSLSPILFNASTPSVAKFLLEHGANPHVKIEVAIPDDTWQRSEPRNLLSALYSKLHKQPVADAKQVQDNANTLGIIQVMITHFKQCQDQLKVQPVKDTTPWWQFHASLNEALYEAFIRPECPPAVVATLLTTRLEILKVFRLIRDESIDWSRSRSYYKCEFDSNNVHDLLAKIVLLTDHFPTAEEYADTWVSAAQTYQFFSSGVCKIFRLQPTQQSRQDLLTILTRLVRFDVDVEKLLDLPRLQQDLNKVDNSVNIQTYLATAKADWQREVKAQQQEYTKLQQMVEQLTETEYSRLKELEEKQGKNTDAEMGSYATITTTLHVAASESKDNRQPQPLLPLLSVTDTSSSFAKLWDYVVRKQTEHGSPKYIELKIVAVRNVVAALLIHALKNNGKLPGFALDVLDIIRLGKALGDQTGRTKNFVGLLNQLALDAQFAGLTESSVSSMPRRETRQEQVARLTAAYAVFKANQKKSEEQLQQDARVFVAIQSVLNHYAKLTAPSAAVVAAPDHTPAATDVPVPVNNAGISSSASAPARLTSV